MSAKVGTNIKIVNGGMTQTIATQTTMIGGFTLLASSISKFGKSIESTNSGVIKSTNMVSGVFNEKLGKSFRTATDNLRTLKDELKSIDATFNKSMSALKLTEPKKTIQLSSAVTDWGTVQEKVNPDYEKYLAKVAALKESYKTSTAGLLDKIDQEKIKIAASTRLYDENNKYVSGLINSKTELSKATGNVRRAIVENTEAVGNGVKSYGYFESKALTSKTALQTLGGALDSVKLKYVALGVAAASAGVAVSGVVLYSLGKKIYSISSDFQQLQIRMEGISGSSKIAKQSMDWVTDFSKKTPLSLKQTADAFVKLASVGINPMKSLKAITDTVSQLGGGDVALEKITLALTQMAGKTKGIGEEFNRQLTNQLVMALPLLNRYYKTTFQSADDAVKHFGSGLKVAEALITAMGDKYAGASAKMMQTASGQLQMLQENFAIFAAKVGENGYMGGLRDVFKSVNDTFDELNKSGKLDELARSLSDVLVGSIILAIEALGDLLVILGQVSKAGFSIKTTVKGMSLGADSYDATIRLKSLNSQYDELAKRLTWVKKGSSDYIETVKKMKDIGVEQQKLIDKQKKFQDFKISSSNQFTAYDRDIKNISGVVDLLNKKLDAAQAKRVSGQSGKTDKSAYDAAKEYYAQQEKITAEAQARALAEKQAAEAADAYQKALAKASSEMSKIVGRPTAYAINEDKATNKRTMDIGANIPAVQSTIAEFGKREAEIRSKFAQFANTNEYADALNQLAINKQSAIKKIVDDTVSLVHSGMQKITAERPDKVLVDVNPLMDISDAYKSNFIEKSKQLKQEANDELAKLDKLYSENHLKHDEDYEKKRDELVGNGLKKRLNEAVSATVKSYNDALSQIESMYKGSNGTSADLSGAFTSLSEVGGDKALGGTSQQEKDMSALKSIYSQTSGEMGELIAKQKALGVLMDKDSKNATKYAKQLRDVNLQMIDLNLEAGKGTFADVFKGGLMDYVKDFTTVMKGLKNSFSDMFKTLSDGFAKAMSDALLFGTSFKDTMRSVIITAVGSLVESLIKLGVQYLLTAAIGTSAYGAQTAAQLAIGLGAMSTYTIASIGYAELTAAAWSSAAAMVSAATFGASAVAGTTALASTVAAAKAMSVATFATGGYTGDGGRGDVAGVVHKREFVMNSNATERNRSLLEAMNSGKDVSGMVGGSGGAPVVNHTQNITINGNADADAIALIKRASKEAYAMVLRDFEQNRSARRALGV
jgi:phage tail tape-measure protein